MSKIRFQNMFCLGIISSQGLIGGFCNELDLLPEVQRFFEWEFRKSQGKVLFINSHGHPVLVDSTTLKSCEQAFYGIPPVCFIDKNV